MRVRSTAAGAVLIVLAPLAACGDEAAAPLPAVEGQGTGRAPVAEGSASPGPQDLPDPAVEQSPGPDAVAEPPTRRPATDPAPDPTEPGPRSKKLRGGGFARSLPGTDAPDRKADTGPQFTISADVDIEEIERLVKAVERVAKQAGAQPLATGGDLAAAVGTFSYRWFADGTVAPDPAWVAANIRTERVPLLGNVTCHRVMLPQLRGALREVVARGLAPRIHPGEYGGCYVPRFIGRDPANGLSLHSWGIAVDLNVPGNQRGVAGEIDRTVVSIFKRWGFAWGGDWAWTDPMHFELNRLVRPSDGVLRR